MMADGDNFEDWRAFVCEEDCIFFVFLFMFMFLFKLLAGRHDG